MQEVAARLGVSVRTVQIRVKNGLMPAGKRVCGGKRRTWHRDEFELWFDGEHRSGPAAICPVGPAIPVVPVPSPSQTNSVVEATIDPVARPDAAPVARNIPVPASPRLEVTAAIKRMQARAEMKLREIGGD
tara:strand:- start:257 stop:649 length:393 start_codon:yes stop_codon:yes gene_type:complete